MRIVAIFAVILIHTSSRTLEVSHFDVNRIWFSLFLNQTFRFAVPLLFLISGFVLAINYKEVKDLKPFYKKRILKLIPPYFFWSIIYFLIVFKNSIAEIFSFKFLYQILVGSASYQLYFIPSLFILYLIFPFLNKFLRRKINKVLFLSLTILELVLLGIDYYVFSLPITIPVKTALFNFYVFYIGILTAIYNKEIVDYLRKRMILILFLTVISLVAVYCSSFIQFINTEKVKAIHVVYSQWRPTIYIYTILLSSVLYYFLRKINLDKYKKIIIYLSQVSFFVFFVHVIYIYFYWGVVGSYLFSKTAGHIVDNLWFDPIFFIIVLFTSLATAYILKFIPKIGWLIGLRA